MGNMIRRFIEWLTGEDEFAYEIQGGPFGCTNVLLSPSMRRSVNLKGGKYELGEDYPSDRRVWVWKPGLAA